MFESEAREKYMQALKLGRKTHRDDVHSGRYPYLQVLDEILDMGTIADQVDLGLVEIPSEMIVGTKTSGRTTAFASNFMPLLPDNSEFGVKWMNLCSAHLGDEGIRDPIRCYEYLGRFYVQEGNKRVSVLKSYGAPSIPGYVTRLIPRYSQDKEIESYYEFLRFYPQTKLYQLRFTQPSGFLKLQAALGYEPEHVWTEDERRIFLSRFYNFSAAFKKLRGESLNVTVADGLLVWLRVYDFDELKLMPQGEIISSLQTIWADIRALGQGEPIAVSTDDPGAELEPGIIGKLKSSVFQSRLKIAFVHELTPEISNWTKAHEEGRMDMEEVLGDRVSTMVYMDVGSGDKAVEAMEDAVKNGAQIIFATTAPLIAPCRKIAAEHPGVKVLNCSISMPYTGVRTYYSRIYEGKFISGAIAGAVSRNDKIGYIASYPIFGVPAGINAFALGAQLTNPRAEIELKWSCVPGDHAAQLAESGIEVVSTLDIPLPGWEEGQWGTFRFRSDGSTRLLASPYWDWGAFYTRLAMNILDGGWDKPGTNGDMAVNYWWGMSSGVIGIKLAEDIPEGVAALSQILQSSIINDSITPFHRRFYSQDGTVRNDGSKYFTFEEILHMDWLCDNVNGSIPPYEELVPKGQGIVRLQGIYRDELMPEKEDVLL